MNHFNPFLAFLEETSIHGGKHVSNSSRSILRRIIWGVFIFSSLSGLLYSSIRLGIELSKYSVKTVYKFEYKDFLEFPTLTICSACPMDISKINRTDKRVEAAIWTLSKWDLTAAPYNINETVSVEFINQVIDQMSIDMESLFLNIKWNGEDYKAADVLEVAKTSNDRKCFVFNGKNYQAVNGSFISEVSGMEAGLEMIVDIKQTYCPGGYFDTSALQIYLHPRNDDDPPRSPKAVLSPGTASLIGLKKSQTVYLPYPYKAIGDRYCTQEANYSKSNCFNECVITLVRDLCPCLPPLTAAEEASVKISLLTEDCNSQELLNSLVCYEKHIVKLTRKAQKSEICHCPDPCTVIEYETDLSFGYFPTRADSQRLVDLGVVPDISYPRENFLKFNMNYNRLLEHTIEYVPEYNLETFLGTIGGHLGLFIGASVLSIIEIIELLILTCWTKVIKIFTPAEHTTTKVKPIKN
ncbi:hypothetical protein LOTGIDRAFT_156895 [Lottia gigantea]|uniref:Uncharacterized protein n=1 Tax=Lottia gigantea TaxID=225164 RepID=V4AFZ1_LOTGI|nr:hypothetical protein LOTGIDRAFT_156895 [Lottia gigantea]ESP02939.1 hypothetical protein LOTGIDRAFT_156895 [Lottia gigantea]